MVVGHIPLGILPPGEVTPLGFRGYFSGRACPGGILFSGGNCLVMICTLT